MIAYTFCIDPMFQCYLEYQFIWDNPLTDGNLPLQMKNGKFTLSGTTGHGDQKGDRWYRTSYWVTL